MIWEHTQTHTYNTIHNKYNYSLLPIHYWENLFKLKYVTIMILQIVSSSS